MKRFVKKQKMYIMNGVGWPDSKLPVFRASHRIAQRIGKINT